MTIKFKLSKAARGKLWEKVAEMRYCLLPTKSQRSEDCQSPELWKKTHHMEGKNDTVEADFSLETMEAGKQSNIFKNSKIKNCQPRILQSMKISFKLCNKMKISSDNWKLRECVASKLTIHRILKEILQDKEKWQQMKIWIYKIKMKDIENGIWISAQDILFCS